MKRHQISLLKKMADQFQMHLFCNELNENDIRFCGENRQLLKKENMFFTDVKK